MNHRFARQIAFILHRYSLTSLKDIEDFFLAQEQESIIRPMSLLWALVPEARWVTYDYEFIESGVISFPDLIRRYAEATRGEWQLDTVRETSVQKEDGTHILLDFVFRGQQFHWEIHWDGSCALQECEDAIHAFAQRYLCGDFVDAGGMLDQCSYLCYLPLEALRAIRMVLEQVRQTWPTADELVAFSQREKDARQWEGAWATIIECSDLCCVNELDAAGTRPLHAAVRQVWQGTFPSFLLPILIGDYHARPDLPDVEGKTAFDWAGGDPRILALLQTPFAERKTEAYADQEWYLPLEPYFSLPW